MDTGGRDGAASVPCLKMSHRTWRESEKLRQAESQTSQLDLHEKHGSKRSLGRGEGGAGIWFGEVRGLLLFEFTLNHWGFFVLFYLGFE